MPNDTNYVMRHGRAWASQATPFFERLCPAIRALASAKQGVDARHKAGHDKDERKGSNTP
jgi:hypothetical protein